VCKAISPLHSLYRHVKGWRCLLPVCPSYTSVHVSCRLKFWWLLSVHLLRCLTPNTLQGSIMVVFQLTWHQLSAVAACRGVCGNVHVSEDWFYWVQTTAKIKLCSPSPSCPWSCVWSWRPMYSCAYSRCLDLGAAFLPTSCPFICQACCICKAPLASLLRTRFLSMPIQHQISTSAAWFAAGLHKPIRGVSWLPLTVSALRTGSKTMTCAVTQWSNSSNGLPWSWALASCADIRWDVCS